MGEISLVAVMVMLVAGLFIGCWLLHRETPGTAWLCPDCECKYHRAEIDEITGRRYLTCRHCGKKAFFTEE